MAKSQYIIQFGGLSIGTHEFEMEVKDQFFEQFTDSEIHDADLNVKLVLLKQNHLMQLDIQIEGTVGIACDRCLKGFDFPIETREHLVIKHGDPEESNDELLVIPEGASEADLAQYLYEYIVLAMPAKRIPCEEDDSFECDYDTLSKLEEYSSDTPGEEGETPTNPIWEQLKDKKFNNN